MPRFGLSLRCLFRVGGILRLNMVFMFSVLDLRILRCLFRFGSKCFLGVGLGVCTSKFSLGLLRIGLRCLFRAGSKCGL